MRKANESMLKSVYCNNDNNIGQLLIALNLLHGSGCKNNLKVFNATEMTGVFVKKKFSQNTMENTPSLQWLPFNTEALRRTTPAIRGSEIIVAGWIIAPPTSITMVPKLRKEAACNIAFILIMGMFFIIFASDAKGG